MRIGYVVSSFPPLTETFIRREILALCDLGYTVIVYAQDLTGERFAGNPMHPNLLVRHVEHGASVDRLVEAVRRDGVTHLHGTLMLEAQQAAWKAARRTGIPFSITAYSGYSVFTAKDPKLYFDLSRDALCAAVVVEDPVMEDWVVERLGALRAKVVQIANSLDLSVFRIQKRPETFRILSIARFVPKKGLRHLIRAFLRVVKVESRAELVLVGGGEEEAELRRESGGHPRIVFAGYYSERQCRQAYQECAVFCLPVVRADDGDADGIPTTVLEAMAMRTPVVVSDLLSAPYYVRHGEEGMLAPPGDDAAIAEGILRLLRSPALREAMGAKGRRRVEELCDLRRNARRLDDLIRTTHRIRWEKARRQAPADPGKWRRQAADFFRLTPGGLIVSVAAREAACFTEGAAAGAVRMELNDDDLPLEAQTADALILHDCLPYAFDMRRLLEETQRVLRPGGRLHIYEELRKSAEDRLRPLTSDGILPLVSSYFAVDNWEIAGGGALLCNATKRIEELPLVSVTIPAYNRARFVVRAVESVLRQKYSPVEVVVVDDGSTDDSAELLERFGTRIRVVRHAVNRGASAAKNSGLRATSPAAKYVAILDSDDFYFPDFLTRCVQFLEENPKIGLAYSGSIAVDEFGCITEDRQVSPIDPWSVSEWLRTRNLQSDVWVARRSLLMETELCDESLRFDEDFDLLYQLLEITDFAHVGGKLVGYTAHDGQMSRDYNEMARAHAANLVKYSYSAEYAYHRARWNPEWVPAIEEGVALGLRMREERARRKEVAARRLAIDGGKPVRREYLVFGQPVIGQEEIDEVTATLRSGWLGTGPRVAKFEAAFAEYTGARYAVALNSCTAGLLLALVASGVGPGDEVITTPLTFAATANVIEHTGSRVVFADIDPVTLNIDPASVEERITPRTKAVLAVHFGGLPCDLDALAVIAGRHGLVLLEDAAHAAGARYKGTAIGGHGRLTAFSFYANKNLTTGEGGMLTTSSGAIAERLRSLRLHGLSADAWSRFHDRSFRHPSVVEPGYKFNMPDLAAAVGLPQLRKLEGHLQRRAAIAAQLDAGLEGLPFTTQPRPAGETRHSLHLYPLLLDLERWTATRDRVVDALRAENIGATVHYRPLHQEPFYREKYAVPDAAVPVASRVGKRILSLPISPAMRDGDVADIVKAVRKVAAALTR